MPRTLRPLSLGKLLDETFDIYRRNFLLFIGISAVPNLVLLAYKLFLVAAGLSAPTSLLGPSVLSTLSMLFATMFTGAIVTAATTFAVSDIYLDTPTSMTACFSRVSGKALRVIYVSIVVGMIIGFGMLLLVIPGVYWAGVYGIAIPAVVLENITGREALKRSSSLTKDSVVRVIVVYFLATIFAFFMVVALNVTLTALASAAFHNNRPVGEMLDEVLSTVGGILFGPVTAIALTLVYYDQRVRKEAFDIEHMMALMAPSENLASSAAGS